MSENQSMRLAYASHCKSNDVRISIYFSLTEEIDHESLDVTTPEEITLDETRGGTYLSLDEIGVFLSRLASTGIYLLP